MGAMSVRSGKECAIAWVGGTIGCCYCMADELSEMINNEKLEGLLDSSLYAYADHPERITVKRRDLEVCLRATISNVILEGGNIASLVRDCMETLDKLATHDGG